MNIAGKSVYQFLVHGFTCGLLKALTCAVDFIKIDCRSSLPIYASPKKLRCEPESSIDRPGAPGRCPRAGNSLPVSKRMHHETGWTAFSTFPTRLAISRCAGLTECRLLSRSENSRRPADQAARVSNPAFIRIHTDECGKCPDEVDNQGNNAVLPGTALVWTLTTTSQSTLISSRDAHGQISDAGAWRTFEIYCTSKTTTHTACSPTAKTRWLSTMRSETA